jgi:hypothetical protein
MDDRPIPFHHIIWEKNIKNADIFQAGYGYKIVFIVIVFFALFFMELHYDK